MKPSAWKLSEWEIQSLNCWRVQSFWYSWCWKQQCNHQWKLTNYFAAVTEVSNALQIVKEEHFPVTHLLKGQRTTDPKSVTPQQRVKEHNGECLCVSNKRLFCKACREKLVSSGIDNMYHQIRGWLVAWKQVQSDGMLRDHLQGSRKKWHPSYHQHCQLITNWFRDCVWHCVCVCVCT